MYEFGETEQPSVFESVTVSAPVAPEQSRLNDWYDPEDASRTLTNPPEVNTALLLTELADGSNATFEQFSR
jgi:hypothetical protein